MDPIAVVLIYYGIYRAGRGDFATVRFAVSGTRVGVVFADLFVAGGSGLATALAAGLGVTAFFAAVALLVGLITVTGVALFPVPRLLTATTFEPALDFLPFTEEGDTAFVCALTTAFFATARLSSFAFLAGTATSSISMPNTPP